METSSNRKPGKVLSMKESKRLRQLKLQYASVSITSNSAAVSFGVRMCVALQKSLQEIRSFFFYDCWKMCSRTANSR